MTWFTETPWWLPTLLILAGAALFVSGNSRRKPRARLGGLAIAALGLILALVSYFLESDREHVERRTNELISAVVSADTARMTPYMDPQIIAGPFNGRDTVTRAVKTAADAVDLQSSGATEIGVKVHGDEAVVDLTVAASTKNGPGPLTVWQLTWNKQGKQWFLKEAELRGSAGESAHPMELKDFMRFMK
jgi:hypothetical protein